ncbi:heat-inducible transcriptional repressor HrcA [Flagellatimonas centrodinii]|uniref:heat-inducible transcriptional repressor HrcA n=1 Tax=Flagellatimonas centrodinii TaxID=2806210 RepID=UPI001FEDC55B|nr:heat-inducible transcriptional repressor HrcA [Flagellatimonas centrodinii]ULQ46409.1 heat-inducible transcriptional repressor HrcA [Flagellatimonas centrodinii]
MSEVLNSRAEELLKLLIQRYIQDGLPVGSRTLSRAAGLGLSAATIRNVMADLDDLGFVASPHTSAGRIPTQRGYRYFVDSLLSPEPLDDGSRAELEAEFGRSRNGSPQDLVQTASSLLSQLSRMAGVVTLPRRNLAVLRRIEFLPLSDQRVLAILVVNQHEVQNRVLQMDRAYGADELAQYANALNERFAGRNLVDLRRALLDEAVDAQNEVNHVLREAAQMAGQCFEAADHKDFVHAGGANLFGFQELADVQRLRGLFDALDRKRDLLTLFDQCLGADGVQVFIGDESGYRVLDEMAVVTSPYYVEGQVAGMLGVIGPTRMAYQRIIPLVRETARILSRGLD